MDSLYLKHRMVRTRLEEPAKLLQLVARSRKVVRHPGVRAIWFEGVWLDRALARLLTPTSNTIDVGAHIGSTLSQVCQLAPRGRHVAYEAVPKKVSWLRAKFPEVDVRGSALGDVEGTVVFGENLTRPAFSGIVGTSDLEGDVVREIEVPCTTLDRDLEPGWPVDYIKIDVEGVELRVLRGACETIARHRPVVTFESGPSSNERYGLDPVDLYRLMACEHGYSIHLPKAVGTDSPGLGEEEFLAAHVYPFAAFNYVALPPRSRCDPSGGRPR